MAGIVSGVQIADDDAGGGGGGVDELPVADIQARMGDLDAVGGEEQQVCRLKLALGHGHAVLDLVLGAPVQSVAEVREYV